MGNCIPAQKTTESPTMSFEIQEEENKVYTESPIKEEQDEVNCDLSMVELNSQLEFLTPLPCEASDREEEFFDSQPWIDSDIEDFLSVNGDCTPLSAHSPIQNSNLLKNPESDESLYSSSNEKPISETSATDMKKQLFELFRESFNNEAGTNQNLQDKVEEEPICRDGNPDESICSSQGKT